MCDNNAAEAKTVGKDFIRNLIDQQIKSGEHVGTVQTRFPPEPNGYLHIGHAKSICLNFGIAEEYKGKCNLRFDDTNPEKEETEYVESIKKDVKWLGFQWDGEVHYASDYFEQLYDFAEDLIKIGKAYVDSQSAEEIQKTRGTFESLGTNSPFRERSAEESLDLFRRMRKGEFKDGELVLRAKIDMSSPNIVMRDPVIYRIRYAEHHRTKNEWCIYPLYDFTHCISDSLEKITHSLCSLEFENNRELYEWVLNSLKLFPSKQTEFARLNITGTILSKRKLIQLVREKHVSGWDDPRMSTLSGVRRRGYTPESIREFCSRVGVARAESMVDYALLEFCIREHLNRIANRLMVVLNPVKITIENYPEGQVEWFDMPLNPEDASQGSRKVPFSRELYIEQDDFMLNPPSKFFRLAPGKEVRLRYAYYITCKDVLKDANGQITEIICSYDPESKGGDSPDGRRVRGTLHWVTQKEAIATEVRLYDRLFLTDDPEADLPEGKDFTYNLNPDSLTVVHNAYAEPALADYPVGTRIQFERLGYFIKDKDSSKEKCVFNRIVSLRDTWAKLSNKK